MKAASPHPAAVGRHRASGGVRDRPAGDVRPGSGARARCGIPTTLRVRQRDADDRRPAADRTALVLREARRRLEARDVRRVRPGPEVPGQWDRPDLAARAVSPQLDYSSLMKLRGYLQAAKAVGAAGERDAAGDSRRANHDSASPVDRAVSRRRGDRPPRSTRRSTDSSDRRYSPPDRDWTLPAQEIVFLATGARDVTRLPPIEMADEAVARFAPKPSWPTGCSCGRRRSRPLECDVDSEQFRGLPGSVLGHYPRPIRRPGELSRSAQPHAGRSQPLDSSCSTI